MSDCVWAVKLIFKKHPFLFSIFLFLYSVVYLLQPAELLLTQKLIVFVTNKFSYNLIITIISLFVACLIFKNIHNSVSSILENIMKNNISKYFYPMLFDFVSKTDLTNLDKSGFLIEIKRARAAIDNKLVDSISNILKLVAGFISTISISIIIVNINPLYLTIFISICILQNLYVIKITKENILLYKSKDIKTRRHNYFIDIMQDRNTSKEIRSYNLYAWLEAKRIEEFKKIQSEHIIFSKKWTIINSIWSLAMFIIEGLMLILMYYQYSINLLSLDQFVLLIQSQPMLIGNVSSSINIVSKIIQDSIYIKDLRKLSSPNLESNDLREEKNNIFNENKSVVIKNIDFSYINGKKALHDISLDIKRGEIIALIGENGSGKSTLSKIICGLLKESDGQINYNTKNIGAVFQDYAKFQLTLKENVILGNLENTQNEREIIEALVLAQCTDLINNLPHGINTFLGKEFVEEGTDISIGQWQRISIARAIFRGSDLIVFDEPTAALDPIAEKIQFENIQQFMKRKSVILVSHRIGLTKLADRIIFMKDGEMKEQGTHDELMNLKNEYFRFYMSQAKWYR